MLQFYKSLKSPFVAFCTGLRLLNQSSLLCLLKDFYGLLIHVAKFYGGALPVSALECRHDNKDLLRCELSAISVESVQAVAPVVRPDLLLSLQELPAGLLQIGIAHQQQDALSLTRISDATPDHLDGL